MPEPKQGQGPGIGSLFLAGGFVLFVGLLVLGLVDPWHAVRLTIGI